MKRKDFILISALIMAGTPLTGKAQLSKSALDYMLQRPQVTKSYKDKKFRLRCGSPWIAHQAC